MISVKIPCLVTQADGERLSHWHLELRDKKCERVRERECGKKVREKEEGCVCERERSPPLEN